ncbi:uncharacterized protein Z519_08743 [Cladophialophora bantiana CBS 173.52]|uniref:Uncharacterized protein n=1 Tax=Cladophialophora bantiana (strain ATCC 10958 / CBS 173.52 / CDC B-1940 / NIH 8579) TaxID=1442370 RepID=A0A0D2HJP0_CLAB1|nr:uncharacterized protein Z519_08743 [Cladophialophora bantiana CBS 173.52]KIW90960.1 hypothetical protein Z519_08743 [Cladophialophora bantiana CBS 173.52]
MHASRLADVFEEFCRPPTSTVFALCGVHAAQYPFPSSSSSVQPGVSGANNSAAALPMQGTIADGSGMTALPGHYLPFEEITLAPHLMPVNPEDEDDVVPDMHAAFGINRALNQNQTSGVIVPGSAASAVAAGAGADGGAMGAGQATGEASQAGVVRDPVWRDLGMEGLVVDASRNGISTVGTEMPGYRREGKRTGLLLLR